MKIPTLTQIKSSVRFATKSIVLIGRDQVVAQISKISDGDIATIAHNGNVYGGRIQRVNDGVNLVTNTGEIYGIYSPMNNNLTPPNLAWVRFLPTKKEN